MVDHFDGTFSASWTNQAGIPTTWRAEASYNAGAYGSGQDIAGATTIATFNYSGHEGDTVIVRIRAELPTGTPVSDWWYSPALQLAS